MTAQAQKIKELHILLNQCNISESDKEAIYSSYGVTSSKDMNVVQLGEICDKLHELLQKDGKEPKPSRRKTPLQQAQTCCKVAIGKLLAKQGKIKASGWGIVEWHLITRTACRAAGVESFEQIPLGKLRGITYEFNNQAKGIAAAREYINNN